VDITVFGRQAETCNEYLRKGRPAFIEGRLQFDTWDDRESGQKRSKLYVVAERVQFLGGRDQGEGGGGDAGGVSEGGRSRGNYGGGRSGGGRRDYGGGSPGGGAQGGGAQGPSGGAGGQDGGPRGGQGGGQGGVDFDDIPF
jgi:single-strand DNA-binding protein